MNKIQILSNKSSKIVKRLGLFYLRYPPLLIFDVGYLKLRDLAKLCFFRLIVTKSNFKKISYDIILVTSL